MWFLSGWCFYDLGGVVCGVVFLSLGWFGSWLRMRVGGGCFCGGGCYVGSLDGWGNCCGVFVIVVVVVVGDLGIGVWCGWFGWCGWCGGGWVVWECYLGG